MKRLNFRFFVFLLAMSCLPVFILLMAVITYSEVSENISGSYFTVVFTSCILIAVNTVISFVLARFFAGKIERILKSLKDVLSLKEYSALEKSSVGHAFTMIVNSFEYYREKRSEDEETKRELTILQGQKSRSLNIGWRKAKNSPVFKFTLPPHWKKTYPGLDLPEKSSLFDYLRPETLSQVENAFQRAEETDGREINVKSKLKVGASEWASVLITGKSVVTETGDIWLTGMITDESRHLRLESIADEYRRMYNFALKSAVGLIYEVEVLTDKLTISEPERWYNLLGLKTHSPYFSVLRKEFWELIDPDFREGFLDRFFNYDHLALFPDRSMSYEYRIKNANGEYIWVSQTVYAVGVEDSGASPHETVTKVIGRINDMNDLKNLETQSSGQSGFDVLTGAYLKKRLQEEYERIISAGDFAALIVADINGFKLVNDLYGKSTGDKVLREVVLTLWENQAPSCLVGRTDGDEFTMLVKTLAGGVAENNATCEEIAEKILRKFDKPVQVDDVAVNITLSVGIAFSGSEGRRFDEVYDSAVKVLKYASKQGANKYEVYGN